jgi:hypothetical protein
VALGPERTGSSVGLWFRSHWRVCVGGDIVYVVVGLGSLWEKLGWDFENNCVGDED